MKKERQVITHYWKNTSKKRAAQCGSESTRVSGYSFNVDCEKCLRWLKKNEE